MSLALGTTSTTAKRHRIIIKIKTEENNYYTTKFLKSSFYQNSICEKGGKKSVKK